MTIIETVRREREELARVLKKHSGIRKIVEDLYPDSAHFIYELLQNAEDTGATEAKFTLTKSGLCFEHNGRPFEAKDIYAITDIGEGTKATDEEKIGRFGIGFKAVFAYTETPRIWSQTFSFQISEMVLPEELPTNTNLGAVTSFEFPFNNPKKPEEDAYSEVKEGLDELSKATLLFLSQLESIVWEIEGKSRCEVLRIEHTAHHVEVLKKIDGKKNSCSHYLRFTESINGMEKQCVAIAFALDHLPKVKNFDVKKTLAEQFRIVSSTPGRVAVFFPAEKETSGLRFHLHAPFVPELSRASIKQTQANDPLFRKLAMLAAKSLHEIRKLKLLRGSFLAVLPNPDDDVPNRYAVIREAIVSEMNEAALTPTYSGGYAPAKNLLQAKASLKNLLSTEDMLFLVGEKDEPKKWAIGATQKNSDVDKFLASLAISNWDLEELLEYLEENADASRYHRDLDSDDYYVGPNKQYTEWFGAKSVEWVQRFYALLYRELEPEYEIDRLENLCIVRLSDGGCEVGNGCYFPSDDAEHDDLLPRVARAVYTSGKKKVEQEKALKLLQEIGVREVGELEQIEAILKQRYGHDEFDGDIKDINRFIQLIEQDPGRASIFNDYFIFECSDGMWRRASGIYLDSPYLATGLSTYYALFGKDATKYPLSENYKKKKISIKKLVKFACALGVQDHLSVDRQKTSRHSMSAVLQSDYQKYGVRYTNTSMDLDWQISGLDKFLEKPTEETSKLIWTTLDKANPQVLEARFRPNRQYPIRKQPSSLVLELRRYAWIPQGNGSFVSAISADPNLLPKGFVFDSGSPWLQAINFGEEITRQTQEYRRKREVAKELGFDDEDSLDDAKWFAKLGSEERKKFKAEYEVGQEVELPDHEPANLERRAARVKELASDAPDRSTEQRTRSVAVSRESVKKEALPYLRQQYTNNDGQMVCQVCKDVLPFKLADGRYFFEAVEFLLELERRHYQNYLALCPNHAAMYQHANGSAELMKDMLLDVSSSDLEVVLADQDAVVWFTKTHINDLKSVIEADAAEQEGQSSSSDG